VELTLSNQWDYSLSAAKYTIILSVVCNYMRPFSFLVSFFILTGSFGQKGKSADQIRYDFNNAMFAIQIRQTKATFFSSSIKQDTVVLTVDAGSICKSKSHLTIKTFENKVVFSETFNTGFFVQGIFEPDTIPQGGQDVYDKFIDKYIKSIPKTKFEKFTLTKIQSFLNNIKANRSGIKQFKEDVIDKQLYQQVMKEKINKVIWFPCFDCEEGVRYFAYSIIKGKAVKILETD
jgi:hypothetical protein